ncbi:hypothetical protein MKW98_005336 [Papaver atlanticum]|uniref:Uncharacterized protein n=1 Tax=Papaver atlanticum TaxID=357466 RepID=A0AAD4X3X7_9MAGN|nr:hypothetical protein MKW98_005336 [Papaver atlanticum]
MRKQFMETDYVCFSCTPLALQVIMTLLLPLYSALMAPNRLLDLVILRCFMGSHYSDPIAHLSRLGD